MRNFITVAAASLAITLAIPVSGLAQTPGSPSKAPTPEAAARFIDSVLGNGVAKIAKLSDANTFSGGEAAESVQTSNCKTVIAFSRGSYGLRTVYELDWRKFVATNSFFSASVTDRWGVRLLVRTTKMYAQNDNISVVSQSSIEQAIGVAVEPGTADLKDRLIRAFEFYGKSCAPVVDSPF